MIGKTIILFATSGSSGLGETAKTLNDICPAANVVDGRMLNGKPKREELKAWVDSLRL